MTSPHIPDGSHPETALPRTTHLAIGAHPDDLEFMAYHGIATCYQNPGSWFTGVTCTDGASSARTGPFAHHTDEQMVQVRHQEQIDAANLGQYNAQYLLNHPSSQIKDLADPTLTNQLTTIIRATRPHTLYTHNPADKHPTHLAVFLATLTALRTLPAEYHPTTFLGCEVWRDLDWLPDPHKVLLDTSAHPQLAHQLNTAFPSQTAGGKRYDLAVEGRRRAHATFHDSHTTDQTTHLTLAMNLMPLLENPTLTPTDFLHPILQDFTQSLLFPFKPTKKPSFFTKFP